MKPVVVKEYLTAALFELLEIKPYGRISINELVAKAGVCRSSFYRNYLTTDGIIDEYLRGVFCREHSLDAGNMEQSVKNIFSNLLEEKKRLVILGRQELLMKLPEYLYETTVSQIMSLNVLNNRYQPYFFAGAASSVITAWIRSGMEESAEEMARIFVHSLGGYMEFR